MLRGAGAQAKAAQSRANAAAGGGLEVLTVVLNAGIAARHRARATLGVHRAQRTRHVRRGAADLLTGARRRREVLFVGRLVDASGDSTAS